MQILAQREKKDEEAFQAEKHYRTNYQMAMKKGYTESQAKNFARVEKDYEIDENENGPIVSYQAPSGQTAYAQRINDMQFLQTPDTPNDYNRDNAWTDDQATHYNEAEYEAETTLPAGYQATLGA